MHYPPPVAPSYEYPISAIAHDTPRVPLGPRARPGEYTVQLVANGRNYTQTLVVKNDPRVKTSASELDQQFNLETRLASILTRSSQAVIEARSVRAQVKARSGQASGALAGAIKGFGAKLKDVLGSSELPTGSALAPETLSGVNGKIRALYGEVDRADVAPTTAQINAADQVERELARVIERWEGIKTTDIPALNRQLHGSHLPDIGAGAAVPPDRDSENEE